MRVWDDDAFAIVAATLQGGNNRPAWKAQPEIFEANKRILATQPSQLSQAPATVDVVSKFELHNAAKAVRAVRSRLFSPGHTMTLSWR